MDHTYSRLATLMLGAFCLSVLSMTIQKTAYDIADGMAEEKDSGISNRNLESFVKRIVPQWSRISAWVGGIASILLVVYVGARFGWPWALGYIVVDHLLKSLGFPNFLGRGKTYQILLAQAREKAPEKVPGMERYCAENL